MQTKGHAVVGGVSGGLSVGVVLWAYQTFVPLNHFKDYRQTLKDQQSEHWQEIKELENKLDAVRMEIARIQATKKEQ